MKYMTYSCSKCGYSKEIEEESMYEIGDCPLCGGYMSFINATEKVEPIGDNHVDMHTRAIEQFRMELDSMGNQRTYETIECIQDAKLRAQYRRYFLDAGGIIPESTIDIEYT